MDWETLRERLRTAREAAAIERRGKKKIGMTLDEAAKKSGLNRATIHSIENVKREPDLKPELDTIERLAKTYGLTLSSFFGQIERQIDSDLQNRKPIDKTVSPPEEQDDESGSRSISAEDRHIRQAIGRALLDAAMALTEPAASAQAEQPDSTVPSPGQTKRSGR